MIKSILKSLLLRRLGVHGGGGKSWKRKRWDRFGAGPRPHGYATARPTGLKGLIVQALLRKFLKIKV